MIFRDWLKARGGLEAKRSRLAKRLGNLLELLLDGTVSPDLYRQQEPVMTAELRAVEEQLAAQAPPEAPNIEAMRRSIEALPGLLAADGSPDALRELLSWVVDGVYCTGKAPGDWEVRLKALAP